MKVRNAVSLFEFAYLVSQDSDVVRVPNELEVISPQAFDYLKAMALSSLDESRLFTICRKQGFEALQVQNYAGVILTPDGTHVEILPKLGRAISSEEVTDARCEQARCALLTMLRALNGFSHLQTSSANIRQQKTPLLEIFVSQFLNSVHLLVKKGMRRDYVCREDNLNVCKGKLNTAAHMRANLVRKQKFFCEYDEFLLDRPANRLLRSALAVVSKLTRSNSNQKLLQELEFSFESVPMSADHQGDFGRLKLDRSMSHYETPLAWSKLILNGLSPRTTKGQHNAISLLFPMEKVFEEYVAVVLKRQFENSHSGLVLTVQAQDKYLAHYHSSGQFKLKPDLLLKVGERNVAVMDTKWKLLDSVTSNAKISQADVYQMFAYAKKYLSEALDGDNVILIYPYQENFNAPLPKPFEFDEQHRMWVVPFVIDEHNPRFILPDGLEFSAGGVCTKCFEAASKQ
ncbi:restriction endonuclease [Vibrio owensii]|uniref:McrC family protein n=1 Tax=Vibrio owensii TaxID=696485 RepID=UPI0010455949|nr:McrC family protein [Vibrio owensii]TDE19926.1 restriction endonuclease [Vibrio owensii]